MAGRQQRRVFVPGPAARRHIVLQRHEEYQRQHRQEVFLITRHRYNLAQKLRLVEIINQNRQDLFSFRRRRPDIQQREQAWRQCHDRAVELRIFSRLPQDADGRLCPRVPRNYWQYFRKLWNVWKSRALERRERFRRVGTEGRLSQLEINICAIEDFIVQNNPNRPPRRVRNANGQQRNNEDDVMDEDDEEEMEGGGVLTEEFQRALFAIGQDGDEEEDAEIENVPQLNVPEATEPLAAVPPMQNEVPADPIQPTEGVLFN